MTLFLTNFIWYTFIPLTYLSTVLCHISRNFSLFYAYLCYHCHAAQRVLILQYCPKTLYFAHVAVIHLFLQIPEITLLLTVQWYTVQYPWSCNSFLLCLSGDVKVSFTYSLMWEESSLRWASRWDMYLSMTNAQIHWFSILNSLVVIFFLAGVLAAIIIRTLKKDIANYNKLDEDMVRN